MERIRGGASRAIWATTTGSPSYWNIPSTSGISDRGSTATPALPSSCHSWRVTLRAARGSSRCSSASRCSASPGYSASNRAASRSRSSVAADSRHPERRSGPEQLVLGGVVVVQEPRDELEVVGDDAATSPVAAADLAHDARGEPELAPQEGVHAHHVAGVDRVGGG
jgi:hypothetical protein